MACAFVFYLHICHMSMPRALHMPSVAHIPLQLPLYMLRHMHNTTYVFVYTSAYASAYHHIPPMRLTICTTIGEVTGIGVPSDDEGQSVHVC